MLKFTNVADYSLTDIKNDLRETERNIKEIKKSRPKTLTHRETQELLKNLKNLRIELLNLKQEKIHSILNQAYCVWCESHSWDKTMTEEKKEYWYVSIHNGGNTLHKFSHEILCNKCLLDWIENEEAIVFAFPLMKYPEVI